VVRFYRGNVHLFGAFGVVNVKVRGWFCVDKVFLISSMFNDINPLGSFNQNITVQYYQLM
jgi:hypothetical protein